MPGGRPRRILHVVTRMNVGGVSRHVLALSTGLRELGFETVIARGRPGPEEGELSPGDEPSVRIEHLRRRLDPVSDYRARAEIDHVILRYRPDVVHTHMAKAGALGRTAARRRHVAAVVHTFHGHVLEGYFASPASRAFVLAERWLARRTDLLVAVSTSTRDDLLALGVGRPEQWRVVPLALDLAPLGADVPRSESRARLGLADVPTVGIVGRLAPIKNHALFLQAASLVARDHPRVRFVIAGDGELRASLEAMAAHELGDRVRFLGWVDDLATLYSALDVVVITSLNEGTPVALIEAAAAGRPVVAADVGGVGEVVVDGETGFLAASGDAGAIAERVSLLLGDPGLAARMGEAGRGRAAVAFSRGTTVEQVAVIYEEILLSKAATAGG